MISCINLRNLANKISGTLKNVPFCESTIMSTNFSYLKFHNSLCFSKEFNHNAQNCFEFEQESE